MNELNKSAKRTKSYTIASFYNDYLGSIERDTVYDIDYNTYRAIVTDYFKHLQHQVIEEGKRIKLPYRLGTLQIIKSKPKYLDKRSLRIDYQATKQTGKYQLVATRANKRRLAQIIKNRELDYEEV